MVLTIGVALGSLLLHAIERSRFRRSDTAIVLVALSALTTALLILRVLIDPPSPRAVVDVKLGGYLGLVSSIGIAVGALDALRGERALRAARQGGRQQGLSGGAQPR
jgi:hypothetical protein